MVSPMPGRGHGRPPSREPITPAEARVLHLVREGHPNAEIAVRLGVTVNTVRYHVSNLLSKAGLQERGQLAQWQLSPRAAPPSPPRTWNRALVASVAVLIVGVAVAVVAIQLGGGDAPVVEGQPGMIDLGQAFAVPGAALPVVSVSPRADLVVIQLAGPGRVLFDPEDPNSEWDFNPTARLKGALLLRGGPSDFTYDLMIVGVDDTDSAVASAGADGAPPTLLIEVRSTRPRARYRPMVDERGHLWVSESPLQLSLVIDEWSGEALDVSESVPLPPLPPADMLFTSCGESTCVVVWRSQVATLKAPVAGKFTCTGQRLELNEGTYTLWFQQAAELNPTCREPQKQAVAEGDDLAVNGHYVIGAVDSQGQALSVVVALDGTLYVGDIAPTVGCPCRKGS